MASGTVAGESIYEVVAQGFAQQQSIKNVWYYRVTVGTPGESAAECLDMWENNIKVPMSNVQHTLYIGQDLVCRRLDSLTDFAERALTQNGTVGGDSLPLHDKVKLDLLRFDKTTRNGWKDIGPISETFVDNGELNATADLAFAPLITAVSQPHTENARQYTPVIVGGKLDANGDTLPESQWRWNEITGAIAQPLLGTRGSRKRRRGV